MSDLIDRQAAIDELRHAQHRFTVADEAGGIGTVKWSEDVIYYAAAERVLTDLPAAESEIVRCKDCKYYVIHTLFGRSQAWCERLCDEFDKSLAHGVESDDYCSRAERRTDE